MTIFKQQYKNLFKSILLSYLGTLSIIAEPIISPTNKPFLHELKIDLNNDNIMLSSILFLCLLFLLFKYNHTNKKLDAITMCFSLLFGLLNTIGCFALNTGAFLKVILSSPGKFCLFVFILIGSSIIFYLFTELIHGVFNYSLFEKNPKYTIISIFNIYPFVSSFIIIFLVQMVYLVFFYPGTTMGDGIAQLLMYYKINGIALSNHHPILVTLIMGKIFDFGRHFGDFNSGLFAYTFLQSVAQAFVFALAIKYMVKISIPTKLRIISLLFFTFCPLLNIYGITLVKDTPYYLVFTLFVISYIEYWQNQSISIRNILQLSIAGLLVWACRNNGLYIVLFSYLFMTCKKAKYSKLSAIIMIFLVLSTNFYYHNYLLPSLNADEGSIREALSVPIQQIIRYAHINQDQMDLDDYTTLQSLFIEPLELVVDGYNPEWSDPTKNYFVLDLNKEKLLVFSKLYMKFISLDPLSFIDAAITQSYGYYFPNRLSWGSPVYYYIEGEKFFHEEMKYINMSQNNSFKDVRKIIIDFNELLRNLPIIGYIYNPGTYTWILLYSLYCLMIKKQYYKMLPFIPLVLTVLINCLSPVNAYMRYQMPLVASLPLFMAYVYYAIKKRPAIDLWDWKPTGEYSWTKQKRE